MAQHKVDFIRYCILHLSFALAFAAEPSSLLGVSRAEPHHFNFNRHTIIRVIKFQVHSRVCKPSPTTKLVEPLLAVNETCSTSPAGEQSCRSAGWKIGTICPSVFRPSFSAPWRNRP